MPPAPSITHASQFPSSSIPIVVCLGFVLAFYSGTLSPIRTAKTVDCRAAPTGPAYQWRSAYGALKKPFTLPARFGKSGRFWATCGYCKASPWLSSFNLGAWATNAPKQLITELSRECFAVQTNQTIVASPAIAVDDAGGGTLPRILLQGDDWYGTFTRVSPDYIIFN